MRRKKDNFYYDAEKCEIIDDYNEVETFDLEDYRPCCLISSLVAYCILIFILSR